MSRVTIMDLAAKLGVSVCTVNNALTDKGRISKKTRQRVIDAARQLGYKPNRMAQSLSRRPIRIITFHPKLWPSFFTPLAVGVTDTVQNLNERKVSGTVQIVPDKSSKKQLMSMIHSVVDSSKKETLGVVVCSGDKNWEAPARYLKKLGIPLVLLGLDIPGVPRLSMIRHDSRRSGKIAAELLASMVSGRPAAIVVGIRTLGDHKDKIDGFMEEAASIALPVAGVYETQDRSENAYPVTRTMLAEHPDIGGIYAATDNSAGICRYCRENNIAGRVKLVTTGIFKEARENIDNGTAQFSLYQRMRHQGRIAARALYEYIAEGRAPLEEILVPPLVALRNTIDAIDDESEISKK